MCKYDDDDDDDGGGGGGGGGGDDDDDDDDDDAYKNHKPRKPKENVGQKTSQKQNDPPENVVPLRPLRGKPEIQSLPVEL